MFLETNRDKLQLEDRRTVNRALACTQGLHCSQREDKSFSFSSYQRLLKYPRPTIVIVKVILSCIVLFKLENCCR